jgi:lysozyme
MSSDASERRLLPVFLFLSAAGFAGIAINEGYTDKAVIPVAGDRPTMGFGSTTKKDGSPVKLGDKTNPPEALAKALDDLNRYETELKGCVKVPLHQYEYEAYVDLAYNVGPSAFCRSTLVKKLNAQDYAGACDEILRWRFFKGKDCSQPKSGCAGVWVRRQNNHKRCQGLEP